MVEFYKRGNWVVGTPVYPIPKDDLEAKMRMMVCPHREYQELGRDIETFDDIEYTVVTEKCTECGAVRMRLFPTGMAEEPFDPSIPTEGMWWERLYNFGNFTILTRKHQSAPGASPITYLSRIDTAGGNIHAGFVELPNELFAPAAIEALTDVERILKLGPERYVKYRSIREQQTSREQIENLQEHVSTLYPVARDIGPEAAAAAKEVLEADIDQEIAELQEGRASLMEQQAQRMKKEAEEIRRKKKGKK